MDTIFEYDDDESFLRYVEQHCDDFEGLYLSSINGEDDEDDYDFESDNDLYYDDPYYNIVHNEDEGFDEFDTDMDIDWDDN